MDLAIDAHGLEKTFIKKRSLRELIRSPFGKAERVHALRGVDVQVARGEIFGILGPNGAGKTTLLKILSCLVLPDAGDAAVGGVDIRSERRVKRMIGLVHSDERSFYWRLTARENLRFFSRLYDLPTRTINRRIEELLERVDMTESADRRFSDYSSGMKQRIAIARALLHDPPIILMDEPTRSLDPEASLSLRRFVAEELRGAAGKTIVLATHDLPEAEALSDRVAVVAGGKIRQVGTVDEVRRWGIRDRRYALKLRGFEGELDARIVQDSSHDGVRRMIVAVDGDEGLDRVLRAVHAAGGTVLTCEAKSADLEDAFARILEEGRGEGA